MDPGTELCRVASPINDTQEVYAQTKSPPELPFPDNSNRI